jgi:hypothetical protein
VPAGLAFAHAPVHQQREPDAARYVSIKPFFTTEMSVACSLLKSLVFAKNFYAQVVKV